MAHVVFGQIEGYQLCSEMHCVRVQPLLHQQVHSQAAVVRLLEGTELWLAGFKSLFDELYDAGLLAVGALEKGLGLSSDEIRQRTSGSSTNSSGATSTNSQRQQSSTSGR